MKIEILKKEELASYKNLIDECFGSSNDLSFYQKYHANAAYQIFVVKDGKTIVGSATSYAVELFTFSFQPQLMIFNVAVKPSHRRQKIAEQLLQHIIKYARENAYRSVALTCLADAYPAHQLYEKIGFLKQNSLKYQLNLN